AANRPNCCVPNHAISGYLAPCKSWAGMMNKQVRRQCCYKRFADGLFVNHFPPFAPPDAKAIRLPVKTSPLKGLQNEFLLLKRKDMTCRVPTWENTNHFERRRSLKRIYERVRE